MRRCYEHLAGVGAPVLFPVELRAASVIHRPGDPLDLVLVESFPGDRDFGGGLFFQPDVVAGGEDERALRFGGQ